MLSFARNCGRFTARLILVCLVILTSLPFTANAQETMADEGIFVSIRRYEGVDPADMQEVARLADQGFLPIMRESEGFVAYYLLPAGDILAAVSLFESAQQATASNEAAREFVAEHLAPLLPNPPKIFEGFVDIGFIEMLDGMAEGDVSKLYASVRIYDDFTPDNLSEFVALVEDGFLPIMRDSTGFFGYYLLHDSEGGLGAVSIFDSEASALASNEAAADFVAENLTAFLPNAPQITSGEIAIAVLASLEDGANLIDDEVFVSVRVYDGIDPANQAEILRITSEGFLTIMRDSDGFVGYYLLPAGNQLAAISLFDSEEQAAASNEAAREFVAEFLAPLLPNSPLIVQGRLNLLYLAALDEMMAEEMASLYASLRIYQVADMRNIEEANRLVETYLLPALQDSGGLFSYYSLSDGVDTIAGLNVFDSEENAAAANEIAAAFVAEHLMDWLPDDPLRINGRLGVAAVYGLFEGVNLAVWSME